MSRPHIPRRAAPRGNPFAFLEAMRGAAALRPKQREELRAIGRTAFDGMRLQRGNVPQHWRSLADLLNIGEALAFGGICNDVDSRESAAIEGGLQALGLVQQRHRAGRSMVLTGEEIAALELGLERFGQQLEYCSLSELEAALKRVVERTRAALAGSAPKGAQVVEVAP